MEELRENYEHFSTPFFFGVGGGGGVQRPLFKFLSYVWKIKGKGPSNVEKNSNVSMLL